LKAFSVGDRVRTHVNPAPHTRLPRYLEGRHGRVARFVGVVPFADERAIGNGDAKQALYTVCFHGDDVSIMADLFESYLEADA